MEDIRNNLQQIQENIENAARKSGRSGKDITLVAVTKTIDPARMGGLLALGVTQLGENKAQELLSKYGLFDPAPDWHMIGHLQTNKVKSIIDKVKIIQSVDSVRLAAEIDRQAGLRGIGMDILIEINPVNEPSKYGISVAELPMMVEHLNNFANIRLIGLMCVAPNVENTEGNRYIYEKMMKLFIDNQSNFAHNINNYYLSMGMTNDYGIAIEEGANMVRIGTALFGSRS